MKVIFRLILLLASICILGADNDLELVQAATRGDLERCKKLVEEGANVNQRFCVTYICVELDESVTKRFSRAANAFETTPLHEAAEVGYSEIIEFLVNHGASVNSMNNCRRTPLHFAARNGHLSCMELLIKLGADDTIESHSSETGKSLFEKFCLERGCDFKPAKR